MYQGLGFHYEFFIILDLSVYIVSEQLYQAENIIQEKNRSVLLYNSICNLNRPACERSHTRRSSLTAEFDADFLLDIP